MPITGIQGFDRSIHEARVWLSEIGEALGKSRSPMVDHGLRGVLVALRDRLPVEETLDLASRMPLSIRGVFVGG
jgi:uncharacterized protein (DUF2267 family)